MNQLLIQNTHSENFFNSNIALPKWKSIKKILRFAHRFGTYERRHISSANDPFPHMVQWFERSGRRIPANLSALIDRPLSNSNCSTPDLIRFAHSTFDVIGFALLLGRYIQKNEKQPKRTLYCRTVIPYLIPHTCWCIPMFEIARLKHFCQRPDRPTWTLDTSRLARVNDANRLANDVATLDWWVLNCCSSTVGDEMNRHDWWHLQNWTNEIYIVTKWYYRNVNCLFDERFVWMESHNDCGVNWLSFAIRCEYFRHVNLDRQFKCFRLIYFHTTTK